MELNYYYIIEKQKKGAKLKVNKEQAISVLENYIGTDIKNYRSSDQIETFKLADINTRASVNFIVLETESKQIRTNVLDLFKKYAMNPSLWNELRNCIKGRITI